jgi:Protein of unknown function (DUF3570)
MTKDNQHAKLIALTAAAFMLHGVNKKVEASNMDPNTTFDYRYSQYTEGAIPAEKVILGELERYSIDVHQFKFKTPISEDTEISISGVQESMTGASPWYIYPDANNNPLQVMSGATIDESRTEINGDFRSYNSSSESTLSLGYSTENDYQSFGFGYSGSFQFNQKLTTLSYGINTAKDYIDATDQEENPLRPSEETKNRLGFVFGFSHVFSKNTLIGLTIGYTGLDGFLSDPYKMAHVKTRLNELGVEIEDRRQVQDSRPDKHNQHTVTLMVREFFPSMNAALHFDYRNYSSDWEMTSDTFEMAWHQNLGKNWQLIPSVRYYEQTQAKFYAPYYNHYRNDGYYSSDYRLSAFSATSGEIKLSKKFEKFNINIAYSSYEAKGDNPGLITYELYSLGMGYRF